MDRHTNPEKIPVQLNIKVPWEFREYLIEVANTRRTSLSDLVRTTLMREFSRERAWEQTREEGATE